MKDEEKGTVDVVFSTLNVVDSDRDVTLPGAFEDGAKTRISAYGHESWFGRLPVGKGTIRELKNEAVMEGQFFLDTTHGLDTFRTVKGMGDLQEWSYGYDPTEYKFGEFEGQRVRFLEKVKTHEVSPVLLGAGINTRTLGAKGLALDDRMPFAEHGDAVVALLKQFADRAKAVAERRVAEGKSSMTDEFGALMETFEEIANNLTGLKASTAGAGDDSVMREYLRSVAIRNGIK